MTRSAPGPSLTAAESIPWALHDTRCGVMAWHPEPAVMWEARSPNRSLPGRRETRRSFAAWSVATKTTRPFETRTVPASPGCALTPSVVTATAPTSHMRMDMFDLPGRSAPGATRPCQGRDVPAALHATE